MLCNVPILKIYEHGPDLEIQCDASEQAIGCYIFQSKSPIYFVFRCLSCTEAAYAQIEKEMVAVAFSCSKLHLLIYGQKVKIFTDHQPLISIMKRDVH